MGGPLSDATLTLMCAIVAERLSPRQVRYARAPPARLVPGEQFVGGVLVRPVLPDLGDLPVANVEHQRVVVLQRPARALGVDRVEANSVLVVGNHVVDLDPEVAVGQLHGPAEVAEHRVNALMVAAPSGSPFETCRTIARNDKKRGSISGRVGGIGRHDLGRE